MASKNNAVKELPSEELSGFCSQIAMMMNAGLALYEGLEALARTHSTSKYAAVYERMFKKFEERGSLHEAMKDDKCWPVYLVEMAGIGEQTGNMENVMEGLAGYYSREARIRKAIVSAVTYPIVLGIMMLLILLVMIVKVLPVFRRVLANLGVAISDSGNVMMNMGVSIAWAVLGVMLVVIIFTVICCILMKTKARKNIRAALGKVFAPFGRVSHQLSASRVASVISMMLSSGFPLDEALDMVPSVLDDEQTIAQVNKVRESLAAGASFEDALAESGMYDEIHNCMIRVGYSVGCADSVMAKIAGEYERNVEDGVANLVSIIEPTLVAVLSIVIGCVLLSVMLPMAGIISSII